MSRFLLADLFLTLVYALTLASFDPWDLIVGAVVSAALLWATRGFIFGGKLRPITRLPQRVIGFIPFALVVAWDIIKGTFNVAMVVLHLRPLRHPGLVVIPFEGCSRLGVAVWSLVITLSPGSFPVDIDWERRVMLVHFLDASEPDKIREEQRRFYQRYQRRVFP
jgi:multisubunit Na+/H+ antiporter MnhE subunit